MKKIFIVLVNVSILLLLSVSLMSVARASDGSDTKSQNSKEIAKNREFYEKMDLIENLSLARSLQASDLNANLVETSNGSMPGGGDSGNKKEMK